MISEGVAALLGAIIGGGLVVVGDIFARRADDARATRRELREAAAELLSFEWHRRVLADYQRSRAPETPDTEVWATLDRERRLAASRLGVNPLAGPILEEIDVLIESTNALLRSASGSDEDWVLGLEEYTAARLALQRKVRDLTKMRSRPRWLESDRVAVRELDHPVPTSAAFLSKESP